MEDQAIISIDTFLFQFRLNNTLIQDSISPKNSDLIASHSRIFVFQAKVR